MLTRNTRRLNLFLATSVLRLAGDRNPHEILNQRDLESPDPEVRFAYLYSLAWAWFGLVPVLGIVGGVVLGLTSQLGGHAATQIGIRVVYFVTAFCLVGGLDAAWRTWVVQVARRRYRRSGRTLDAQATRLMTVAWVNDWTLLLQFAAGVMSAIALR